ncbi:MAG TPA: hypothetical protein VHC43_15055 [Mycobacteriales bacterium]|nr:hypothetical protein [Mycobacteriales bacterium]
MKRTIAESAGRPRPRAAAPRQRSSRVYAGWDRRARARMLRAFLSLDLSPLARLDRGLSMVTLTLPTDWERYASTGAAWAALLRKFWQRFDRAFPDRRAALVKTEFQRRGAPHCHILLSAPLTLVPFGRGNARRLVSFREWVSLKWADVVGAEGSDRAAHERAGTQVKPWSGAAASAVSYYAKYAVKGSARRHYQDDPPVAWKQPGTGLTRVLSHCGMSRMVSEEPVTDHEAVWAQRILRRWHRSKSETVRVRVDRGRGQRWVTRPVRMLRSRGGWLAVPDAPSLAVELHHAAHYVAARERVRP